MASFIFEADHNTFQCKILVLPVMSGVPQGSVLRPLLFLVFINDLPASLSVSCQLYADDCILFQNINDNADSEKLNRYLMRVQKWATKSQMKLNFS